MALSNTELAQLLQTTIDGWQAFVTSVKAWGTAQTNTTTFDDPLGGPDLVVETLYKINADYAALTGSEWAITAENVLVPSGNLVDQYSAYHWAQKSAEAAAGVASVAAEVAAAEAASAASQEWAITAENVLVPSGNLVDQYSSLHWSAKAELQVSLAADQVTLAAQQVSLATGVKNDTIVVKDAAVAASDAAALSESNAGLKEVKAGQWADESENIEVVPGRYSANHWALKAQGHSTAAAGQVILAQAEVTNAAAQVTLAQAEVTKASEWAITAEDVQVPAGGAGDYSAYHWAQKALAYSQAIVPTEFDSLTDVDLTGRTDGMVPYYDLATDSIKFQTPAAGGGGTSEFDALIDVDITGRLDNWVAFYDSATDKVMFRDLSGEFAAAAHNHDGVYSASGHNHSGVYEPVDVTLLRDADIGVSVASQGHSHAGTYEPAFSKLTAFNKNFGTAAGTVAQGNHTHAGYEPADGTILKDADIGVTVASQGHNHSGVYEPVFGKLSAFNKNFGTAAGTVAQGNHAHTGVYEPAFSKNTGFNKSLGVNAGQVAEGNHSHSGVYEPAFAKNTGFNKSLGTGAGTVAEGNHTHSGYATADDPAFTGVVATQLNYRGAVPASQTSQYYPYAWDGAAWYEITGSNATINLAFNNSSVNGLTSYRLTGSILVKVTGAYTGLSITQTGADTDDLANLGDPPSTSGEIKILKYEYFRSATAVASHLTARWV